MQSDKTNEIKIVSETKIILNGKDVEITSSNPSLTKENILKALESMKFQAWLKTIDLTNYTLKAIQFRDIFMFGPSVGFVCFNNTLYETKKAEGLKPTDKLPTIPGYVFLRGDAVCVLVIVSEKETGKKHLLLTEQYRPAMGRRTVECPAGMMDDSSNFKGQAATELEEEAGIKIEANNLKELITYSPSGGGCDEKITCLYTEMEKTQAEIKEIESKLYGLQDHGEFINVKMVDFEVEKIIASEKVLDSKLAVALFAYQNLVLKKLQ